MQGTDHSVLNRIVTPTFESRPFSDLTMIIQPLEPQVDCPITTAIFLPETQRFLKFHQTKQNLEIHGAFNCAATYN